MCDSYGRLGTCWSALGPSHSLHSITAVSPVRDTGSRDPENTQQEHLSHYTRGVHGAQKVVGR